MGAPPEPSPQPPAVPSVCSALRSFRGRPATTWCRQLFLRKWGRQTIGEGGGRGGRLQTNPRTWEVTVQILLPTGKWGSNQAIHTRSVHPIGTVPTGDRSNWSTEEKKSEISYQNRGWFSDPIPYRWLTLAEGGGRRGGGYHKESDASRAQLPCPVKRNRRVPSDIFSRQKHAVSRMLLNTILRGTGAVDEGRAQTACVIHLSPQSTLLLYKMFGTTINTV